MLGTIDKKLSITYLWSVFYDESLFFYTTKMENEC